MSLNLLKRNPLPYLLKSQEPWVKYNMLLHLQHLESDDPEVITVHRDLLTHPLTSALLEDAQKWPGYPLANPNDGAHPIHKIGLLADLGFKAGDPGMDPVIKGILMHQSPEGAFQTRLSSQEVFGSGTQEFAWTLCDAPTLLYALLSFGLTANDQVKRSVEHLKSLVRDNGWPCVGANFGFHGFGNEDHCPYANLIALKALAQVSSHDKHNICQGAIEAQLSHWQHRRGRKIFMFGIGRRFQRLEYPHIWYNILHVMDVLSCFESAREDKRFLEMLTAINTKQQENAGFIPESIRNAYPDWDFSQKKKPSPWLTYKIALINARCSP